MFQPKGTSPLCISPLVNFKTKIGVIDLQNKSPHLRFRSGYNLDQRVDKTLGMIIQVEARMKTLANSVNQLVPCVKGQAI